MAAMELGLDGQRITRACFDYGISLQTDAEFEIRIETDWVVHSSGDLIGERLGHTPPDAGRILVVLNQVVSNSTAEDSGALSLTFSNGTTLRVEPHEMYEAWTVSGPHGMKVVGMPGGELAVWSDDSS